MLFFTGLNQVIKVVDEQILNKKRQQEILVSRFKNDIDDESFTNLCFSLEETNNKFIINKYKNFIDRIQDIDRIYETDNIVLVSNSLKNHINKFVNFIQLNNLV